MAGSIVQVEAVAEFTEDMADTLRAYFRSYAVEGVVSVEVSTHGLWLVNPIGGRQFLGLARFTPSMRDNHSGAQQRLSS